MTEGIPPIVQDFVRQHIRSVEAVETLLLLHQSADRDWTAQDLSAQLYTHPDAVARRLDDLTARGLVARTAHGYRYRPRTGQLGRAVDALADVYKRRRVRLVSFIFSGEHRRGQDRG